MAVQRTIAWADVSDTQPAHHVVQPVVHAAERPDLRTIVRRVSASLLVACVVPMSLFFVVFWWPGSARRWPRRWAGPTARSRGAR